MNKFNKIFLNILLTLFCLNDIVYAAQSEISLGSIIFKMIAYIGIIILIILLAKYVTKIFANSSRKYIKSKYIKIIDVLNLGTNTKLIMVEVNENVYFLVMTNSSIEIIDKFSMEEINIEEDFEEHLDKFKGNFDINKNHLNNISNNIQKIINGMNRSKEKEEEYNEEYSNEEDN